MIKVSNFIKDISRYQSLDCLVLNVADKFACASIRLPYLKDPKILLTRSCVCMFEYLRKFKEGKAMRNLSIRIISSPASHYFTYEPNYELKLVAKDDRHGHTIVDESQAGRPDIERELLIRVRNKLKSDRPLMARPGAPGVGGHPLNFRRIIRSKSSWTIHDFQMALQALASEECSEIEWAALGDGLEFRNGLEEEQFIECLKAELSLRQRNLTFIEKYGAHRTLFDILYPS